MKIYKAFGFWSDEDDYSGDEFPHPSIFVDENLDATEKEMIVDYLKLASSIQRYRGFSNCRFKCHQIPPGSSDMTDGEYIFPSGFIHYVVTHNVRPPSEVMEKIIEQRALTLAEKQERNNESLAEKMSRENGEARLYEERYEIDYDWWKYAGRNK